MKTIPLLLCDFYKTVHAEQYPKDVTKIVSYFTPRMSRVLEKELIMFGLQGFIKKYLIDYFEENFFKVPEEDVMKQYKRILDNTLGAGIYGAEKVRKLHQLGYLPIEIRALAEGTKVPIHIPMFEITNTHPDFAWVVNALETLISCSLWHPMISANVGYKYRQIVNKYYQMTCDDNLPRARALGDFSMRGQESLESAVASSAGFLTSFLNTATVPAITYLEEYYNCDCEKEPVGYGAISTEHSVMCSNYAIDGDEVTFIRRLLTEIYPNSSFSMVSDSYDYWRLVTKLLPQCEYEIRNHNGTLLVRGDSGDPIDIVTGTLQCPYFKNKEEAKVMANAFKPGTVFMFEGDTYGKLVSAGSKIEIEDYEPTPEELGTVRLLWKEFGGTVNSKGYRVLDPHIKAIYGDSITPQRAEAIYQRLQAARFAASNVSLGVGSFSMQCVEEDSILKPFTRDTFGKQICRLCA